MAMASLARRVVSSSVTVARWANGSHLHHMDGYSLLEQALKTGSAVTSSEFSVGGRKWELLLYPNGINDDHRGSVSADLKLAYGDRYSGAMATYRGSILDYDGNPAHSSRTVGPCGGSDIFSSPTEKERIKNRSVVDELVAAEELRRSAQFLLRDDRLNVLCDVSVVETTTTEKENTETPKESKRRSKYWFMGF